VDQPIHEHSAVAAPELPQLFENPIREFVCEGFLDSLEGLEILLRAVLHPGKSRNGIGSIHGLPLRFTDRTRSAIS
jgi:hypothetical protein